MSPDFRLDGQLALVTGATGGLGFRIAAAFAGAGATVALHGRETARVSAACEQIAGAIPLVCDLADEAAIDLAIAELLDRHGPVTILVGNAGLRDRQDFATTSTGQLRQLIDVNLVANFALAQRLAPGMIAAGGGRMIFIASVAAIRGAPMGSTYAASKSGLTGLTRALARELGPHRICVNAISPGFFLTEYNERWTDDPDVQAKVLDKVPLQRWASASEITGPALMLASAAGSYVNGHHLVVDGGLSIAT